MNTPEPGAAPAHSDDSCGECPVAHSRREFLRDVGISVVAAVAAIAVNRPAPGFAETIGEVAPLRSSLIERTYAIPGVDGVFIDIPNELILARWENRVYAFSLKCPHKGARLEWRASEQRVFCPKHKSRFLASGTHLSGRGSRDLDRYEVRQAGNGIVVNLARLFREDRSRPSWEAAVVDLS